VAEVHTPLSLPAFMHALTVEANPARGPFNATSSDRACLVIGGGGGFGGGRGGGRSGPPGRGGGRGRGRGGVSKGGRGGMKGGSKVSIEAHRHEGIFIARGKEDALVTKNMVRR